MAEEPTFHLEPNDVRRTRRLLLRWYRRNGRHALPWRRTREPWPVLLAELMLQRTRADLVVPVYAETLRRFPTAAGLAEASDAETDELLRPLGLRHRVPRIRAAAAAVHAGVPRSARLLRQVPGVGPYAAAATLCFAFGRRVAIVDPNIIRILERLLEVRSDRTRARTDPAIWAAAQALLPTRGAREWNYALLDLGSTTCLKKPHCQICPLLEVCPTGQRPQPATARHYAPSR